jgi:hypothetical protein
VLNVSDISYRNCAGSENHTQERTMFVFSSPLRPRPVEQVRAGLS